VYDSQMISEEQLQELEHKRELRTKMFEKNAGEKYQKEKEVMNRVADMAELQGKSLVEMMAELVKTFGVKPKQK